MYKNKLLLTGNARYMCCNRVGLAVVHTTVLELKSPFRYYGEEENKPLPCSEACFLIKPLIEHRMAVRVFYVQHLP